MAEPLEILVTNDDGFRSEGIILLAKALKEIGPVFIVAPDRERTAVAHSITLHRPLRLEKIKRNVYAVDGTPADCVHLAVNSLLARRPALVVSGINKGGNLGDDVTYSGTVSGAIEGTLLGIPSFAVSLVAGKRFRFGAAAAFAVRVAGQILKNGLPKDTLLNINVPNVEENRTPSYRITRQGRWMHNGGGVIEKTDPRGRKYYWIGEGKLTYDDAGDTDFKAISNSCISVTPLHLDLTNYASLRELKKWKV
jgi:5'-nucleotidase